MSSNDPYGLNRLKEKQEKTANQELHIQQSLSDILMVMKKMSEQLSSIEKTLGK